MKCPLELYCIITQMHQYEYDTKQRARRLRATGASLFDISNILGNEIPKSTLSGWFKGMILPTEAIERTKTRNLKKLAIARIAAKRAKASDRQKYLSDFSQANAHLSILKNNKDIAKIILSILFLAEGSKISGCIVFGNSDRNIIKLFLHLLRMCYKLNETKMRCTVQCRADQKIIDLEKYWSTVTRIPLNLFCKPQFDRRSIGKPTMKKGYMGVCRITYYSAHIFHDLMQVIETIYKGL